MSCKWICGSRRAVQYEIIEKGGKKHSTVQHMGSMKPNEI